MSRLGAFKPSSSCPLLAKVVRVVSCPGVLSRIAAGSSGVCSFRCLQSGHQCANAQPHCHACIHSAAAYRFLSMCLQDTVASVVGGCGSVSCLSWTTALVCSTLPANCYGEVWIDACTGSL